MEKHYRFAGIEITASIPDPWMYEDDSCLKPFRVSQVEAPHVFRFTRVQSLEQPEGELKAIIPGVRAYGGGERSVRYIGSVDECWENAYIRAEFGGKNHSVQVRTGENITQIGVKTVLNALCAEHLVAQNDGFVFHCAYIAHNGAAILFTAPSGTGKSTQAELWRKHRDAEIINGDRAAVRVKDGLPVADGIPFSGSSAYCENCTLPLAAIVYLSQAPRTTIRKLRPIEAFSKIWEGISVNAWEKEMWNGCLLRFKRSPQRSRPSIWPAHRMKLR